MNGTRRHFLAGLAGLAGGLILPPTLADNVEAVGRRYWALDSAMLGCGPWQKMELHAGDVLIMRKQYRSTPHGYEDRIVWLHPDYHGRAA